MSIWIWLAGPYAAPVILWYIAYLDDELNPWVWADITTAILAGALLVFPPGLLRLACPFVLGYGTMLVWKMTHTPPAGRLRRD